MLASLHLSKSVGMLACNVRGQMLNNDQVTEFTGYPNTRSIYSRIYPAWLERLKEGGEIKALHKLPLVVVPPRFDAPQTSWAGKEEGHSEGSTRRNDLDAYCGSQACQSRLSYTGPWYSAYRAARLPEGNHEREQMLRNIKEPDITSWQSSAYVSRTQ